MEKPTNPMMSAGRLPQPSLLRPQNGLMITHNNPDSENIAPTWRSSRPISRANGGSVVKVIECPIPKHSIPRKITRKARRRILAASDEWGSLGVGAGELLDKRFLEVDGRWDRVSESTVRVCPHRGRHYRVL